MGEATGLSPVQCGFESHPRHATWPIRLTVRTSGSQPGNGSSILPWVTSKHALEPTWWWGLPVEQNVASSILVQGV